MENYAKLAEIQTKLNEFSFIKLLSEPENIGQNLVIGYDSDFPFVVRQGQIFILEDKIERPGPQNSEPGFLLLKCCHNSTFIFIIDKSFDLIRFQGFDQLLNFRTIFITFTNSNDIDVRRGTVFYN